MAKDPWVQPHFRIKMDQKCVGPAPCLSPCAAVGARSPWGCQLPAWKAWGVAFKIYVIVGLSTCVCMYMYIYTYIYTYIYIYIHIYIYIYIYIIYIIYIYIKSHDTLLTRTSCWVHMKNFRVFLQILYKNDLLKWKSLFDDQTVMFTPSQKWETMMTLDRLILVIKHHFEMITPAAPFPKLNAILKMVSVHFQRRNQYYDRFGDTESQCLNTHCWTSKVGQRLIIWPRGPGTGKANHGIFGLQDPSGHDCLYCLVFSSGTFQSIGFHWPKFYP